MGAVAGAGLTLPQSSCLSALNQLTARRSATDRGPQRYKESPEVNIRQRDAPSDGILLCVLHLPAEAPTFREVRNEKEMGNV